MNLRFRRAIDSLDQNLLLLRRMRPVRIGDLPREMPVRGIYLFSEGREHLYVGRSNRIRQRLQGHVRNSHYTATFAFLLARESTGARASYQPKGSRAELLQQPRFARAFQRARERVRAMDVRFVEEVDPTRQALLEIYAAMACNTPYNNFDNH